MTDCRLTISSRGHGWENNSIMPAEMEADGGVTSIYYKLDGDDCTLTFSEGRVEQLRRGGVNIKLSFVCGQKTACIIGDDNLRGGYEIFTTRLEATVKSLGVNAHIEYLSGGDREHVRVKIRALAMVKKGIDP